MASQGHLPNNLAACCHALNLRLSSKNGHGLHTPNHRQNSEADERYPYGNLAILVQSLRHAADPFFKLRPGR